MFDSAATRRLAAIVSIDVAGYSALAEADEPAAVSMVRALTARIEAAAAAHGGRVFNTAGDGFMLEFPALSGALAAAEAIRAEPEPPVRIGVHLGEITATPSGDLLGHGVNVAARLQALAKPGEILITDDVKRALRGPVLDDIAPRGRVKLDKMSETGPIHAFKPKDRPAHAPPARRPDRRLPLAIAAGLVLIAGVGLFAAQRWIGADPGPLRIAVIDVSAPTGDAEAGRFASGLTSAVASALTDRHLAPVSREAAASRGRGGARLLVNGTTERAGEILRVRISVDDAQAGLSLWAATIERPAREGAGLQNEAAARVADVITGAIRELGDSPLRDAEVLGGLMNLIDMGRLGHVGAPEYLALSRQMVKRAPSLSRAHSDLAWALALNARGSDRDFIRTLQEEATREARKALELDPHNGDAYNALYAMTPRTDFRRRITTLRDGLAIDPQQPDLMYALADLFREVGRLREALPIYQVAVSLDPLSPSKTSGRIYALSAAGQIGEAEVLSRKAQALWPDRGTTRRAALHNALIYWAPDKALKALADYQTREPALTPQGERAWRSFAEGRKAGRFTPGTTERLRAAARAGQIDETNAVAALSMAGDVDGAFAIANETLDRQGFLFSSTLFEPATAAMRASPKFFTLVDRLDIGLFWRVSHQLPDFCSEPGQAEPCATIGTRWWNGSRRYQDAKR